MLFQYYLLEFFVLKYSMFFSVRHATLIATAEKAAIKVQSCLYYPIWTIPDVL